MVHPRVVVQATSWLWHRCAVGRARADLLSPCWLCSGSLRSVQNHNNNQSHLPLLPCHSPTARPAETSVYCSTSWMRVGLCTVPTLPASLPLASPLNPILGPCPSIPKLCWSTSLHHRKPSLLLLLIPQPTTPGLPGSAAPFPFSPSPASSRHLQSPCGCTRHRTP